MSRVVHTNIWSAYGYARKAGYEGTEEEFEQGLKKSAEAAGNAEESAYTASEAATEADAARDAAAQSAESASTSEGNALEYANSAAQVLRDAQAVAQTVNAKATEAAGSASRAENYAQTATTKASEAATAAGTATTAATSASGSAQAADASATAAAASETNAAASASSASTSAGSASESADDAAESAAAAQAVKDSIPADYSQLSADVTDLKSHLGNSTGNELLLPNMEGYISFSSSPISLTPQPSPISHPFRCGYFPCQAGDVFTINGTQYGSAAKLYGFVDSALNVLTTSESGANIDTVAVAPENTSYIVINDHNNTLKACRNVLLVKRVNEAERQITDIESVISKTLSISKDFWQNKGIVPGTGVIEGNQTRLLANIPYTAKKSGVNNGYSYAVFAWDGETYLGWYNGTGFVKTGITWTANEINLEPIQIYTLYAVVRNASNTAVTINDAENFYYCAYTDALLDVKNMPADSYAVGKEIGEIKADIVSFYNVYNSPAYYSADDKLPVVMNFTDLIGLYDTLVAENENYVTKNTLTSGSFTNYEYVFSMGGYNAKRGNRVQDAETNKPIILIMSGVHGHERSSINGLYLFCKALCENPSMSALREGYVFKVIPVVCPWGFNHDSRVNENGVNINRNFDADWVLTPDDGMNYSGAEPADQSETKVVQAWMDSNVDALLEIDWHNSAYSNEICYFATCISTGYAINAKKGYFDGIAHIIEHWIKDRGIVGSNTIYSYTGTDAPGGQSTAYAKKIGLSGSLFETSWNIGNYGKDGDGTIGVNAEAFCAMVKGTVNALT